MKRMHIINCLVFPAWAGVIRNLLRRLNNIGSVPRVVGGDPNLYEVSAGEFECSPRRRG